MESSTEIQPQNNLNEVNRRNFSAKEKLKFNDTIIEIDDNRPGKINDLNDDQQKHYQQQTDDLGGYDGEMTESEYQMRENYDLEQYQDDDDTVKRSIYKQALAINQTTLISPKFQRIHEGVSRVFGLDDPPPGFGLIYPKYYYLEQKRPQPMSPLKVWRGFNGNIYFEPIHLQNLNSSSNDITEHSQHHNLTFNRQNTQRSIKSIDHSEHNQRLNSFKNNNQKDCFIDELDGNNRQNTQAELKFDLVTNRKHDTTSLSKENTAFLLEEASHILLANTLNKRSQTFFQVKSEPDNDLDTMSSTSINATRKITKLNSLILKRPENQREHSKLRINMTESVPNRILPNLAAVKRNNMPLRGLAYREAKNRIFPYDLVNEHPTTQQPVEHRAETLSTNNTNGINYGDFYYNKKATPEEIFRNTNSTATNSSYLRSESPHKMNYKDMLKGLRKGVTATFNSSVHLNRDIFDDENGKKFSIKDNQIAIADKKPSKMVITHRNFKILNIKGDRISNIDIIVPKPATNVSTTVNRDHAADAAGTSIADAMNAAQSNVNISDAANLLNEKSRTDINPKRINKIVIKAKVHSPSMLSLKSNISLVSLGQTTANRRANPSPEMT